MYCKKFHFRDLPVTPQTCASLSYFGGKASTAAVSARPQTPRRATQETSGGRRPAGGCCFMDRGGSSSQPSWGRRPAKALDLSVSYRNLKQNAARLNPMPSYRAWANTPDDSMDSARVAEVPFVALKKLLLTDPRVDTTELFACVNKHDLVRVARRRGVRIGALLDGIALEAEQQPGLASAPQQAQGGDAIPGTSSSSSSSKMLFADDRGGAATPTANGAPATPFATPAPAQPPLLPSDLATTKGVARLFETIGNGRKEEQYDPAALTVAANPLELSRQRALERAALRKGAVGRASPARPPGMTPPATPARSPTDPATGSPLAYRAAAPGVDGVQPAYRAHNSPPTIWSSEAFGALPPRPHATANSSYRHPSRLHEARMLAAQAADVGHGYGLADEGYGYEAAARAEAAAAAAAAANAPPSALSKCTAQAAAQAAAAFAEFRVGHFSPADLCAQLGVTWREWTKNCLVIWDFSSFVVGMGAQEVRRFSTAASNGIRRRISNIGASRGVDYDSDDEREEDAHSAVLHVQEKKLRRASIARIEQLAKVTTLIDDDEKAYDSDEEQQDQVTRLSDSSLPEPSPRPKPADIQLPPSPQPPKPTPNPEPPAPQQVPASEPKPLPTPPEPPAPPALPVPPAPPPAAPEPLEPPPREPPAPPKPKPTAPMQTPEVQSDESTPEASPPSEAVAATPQTTPPATIAEAPPVADAKPDDTPEAKQNDAAGS